MVKTMRKYLSKPLAPAKPFADWPYLYRIAVARAEARKDPRLGDLVHYAANPEKALRRLSIISEVDLNREFPE